MPYYLKEDDRTKLDSIRLNQVCAECGGRLQAYYDLKLHLPYLQCRDHPEHEGIARITPYTEYNIEARREIMVQEHGADKALALRHFDHLTVFVKEDDARKALATLWPSAAAASPEEFAKALSLCIDYGADPRIGDLYMLPFNTKEIGPDGRETGKKKLTFEVVRGIKFTRKTVRRKHKVAFLDDTPRLMTDEEEKRYYRTVDRERIRYITKIQDMVTGETASGRGEWPVYKTIWENGQAKKVKNNPKGMDKGNSMENQASIHSERAAYDLLYPLDLPQNVRVYDEQYAEAEYRVVSDSMAPPERKWPAEAVEPQTHGQPKSPEEKSLPELEEEIFGPQPHVEPGETEQEDPDAAGDAAATMAEVEVETGEVPMTQEEQTSARDKLRDILQGTLKSLVKLRDGKGKYRYPQQELLERMSKTAGTAVEKITDIPDDKLSQVANEMDVLLQISEQ